jgi:RNA polymerase sigma-70 factor, ECF subfamily
MATTALEMNSETVVVEGYGKKVEELTDVIIRYLPRFRRIALCHLRDPADAEDAVQDALLSALSHVDQFRGRAKMSTWLTAIVINSARMQLRRHSARPQIALGETGSEIYPSLAELVSDGRPGPEEMYRNREIAETVAHATSRLSPTLRTAFQLRDVDGMSIRETARLLEVPAGTIKARTARARKKLKQIIQKRTQGHLRRAKVGFPREVPKITMLD